MAFAVSSYFCGVAGAMMIFWYGGGEANGPSPSASFNIPFMVIGAWLADRLLLRCGSILPTALKPARARPIGGATAEHVTHAGRRWIILFLIIELHGLARLW